MIETNSLAPIELGTRPPGCGAHILVVDEDAALRRLVARTLRQAGYQVLTVASGPAALQQFMRQRIDLVLLDGYLPGLNGYAVCAALRK